MNEKAKVYFTNFRANPKMNLLQKLKKLIIEAGTVSYTHLDDH